MGDRLKKYMLYIQKYGAFCMLIFLILWNVLFTKNFFAFGTLNNIITQICPTILCGMGMTLVISTGGIDISVGSVMALSGVITAGLMQDIGIVQAVLLALATSVLVGAVNGFCIGKLKLQAMVITLGMQLAVRGMAQVLCGGRDIYFNKLGAVGESLSLWGSYKMFGFLPIQVLPMIFSIILVWLISEKMVLGGQIQAVGDNIRSSTLSGINAVKVMIFVYSLCAFLAAFAGIFQAARVKVAAGSSLGQLAELDAIAAVVIGGTSMQGGRAKVIGTIIGALIMQMITLSCVMNNIPDEYAQVLKAAIIVLAIFIQREKKD